MQTYVFPDLVLFLFIVLFVCLEVYLANYFYLFETCTRHIAEDDLKF